MELFALFQVLMDSSTSIYAGHIGDIELSSIAVYQETVKIRRITLPVALSQLFQFLTNSSTSIYVGRVGDIELSSISVYQASMLWVGTSCCLASWNKYSHKGQTRHSNLSLLEFVRVCLETEVYSKHFSLKRSVKGRTPQMETPLVIQKFTSESDYLPVKSLKDLKFVLWTETVKIWRIAFPMALSALLQFLTISSTSIYAGHLGDIELSSISVYQGVISAIYFDLLFGMSSALVTLCGQAFGAGQIQSTCIYVQRSWIILTATCIILLPIYVCATPILKFIGQDHEIADLAGRYSIQVIPYMFSCAITFPFQTFLQAQIKVKVITCIALAVLVIQNVLLYIFINVFGWGTTGLAMVTNITGWVYAMALVVYTIGWCKEEWTGFSWMAFRDLWSFAKLSLASSVMSCLEQWYGTCIILLAGLLDNPVIDVGSYSICFNVQGWHTMLLLGISVAISIRVSNTLGMSHPRAAIYSFCVTMFQSLLLGIVFMIAIFLSKDEFAKIFTDSEDMIRAVADLAYLLGVSMVINSASQVMSGVAVGSGWQVMVGYINLACYYVVGLPIGIFLGFNQHLGVKGLWGGTMCGRILQMLVLLIIIWKTNWSKEVEQTAHRMRIWSINNLHSNDMGNVT
ncbi:hypothetical protein JHK84_045787 [Glycine max]|nr:hypothetical protein JHK85_046346 [Glycine max]KAG5108880.1 hypothetical protein JHK84_045787 [Glycine max]